MTSQELIATSHADIFVQSAEGGDKGLPIVLLHGNSSSSDVFRHQFDADLGASRIVAIDLPGHGRSGRAIDPVRSYSMPGYADMAVEVLEKLGIDEAVVFGCSLGGHVGIEMISRFPGLAGLMISGTSPVSPTPESVMAGFRPNPVLALLGQETLSEAEIESVFNAVYGESADPALRDAIRDTDGRARRLMFEGLFAGQTADQKRVVETTTVPLAIVDGARDPFVNLDYIAALTIPSLWERHSFRLRGAGHAPFYSHPDRFNPLLARFLRDAAAKAGRGRGDAKPGRRVAAA